MEAIRIQEQASEARCPYCHDVLDAEPCPCARCGSLHHADCLADHGCAV